MLRFFSDMSRSRATMDGMSKELERERVWRTGKVEKAVKLCSFLGLVLQSQIEKDCRVENFWNPARRSSREDSLKWMPFKEMDFNFVPCNAATHLLSDAGAVLFERLISIESLFIFLMEAMSVSKMEERSMPQLEKSRFLNDGDSVSNSDKDLRSDEESSLFSDMSSF